MVFLFEPGNGQVVGIIAAEVRSVPYFELINLDVEKANREVQTQFSQMLNSFSRQMDINRTSAEFLWQSVETKDQTYEAQVKMFVIFRMLGSSVEKSYIESSLKNLMKNFRAELAVLNYEVQDFKETKEYDGLQSSLTEHATTTTYAVTKKERIYTIPMLGLVYGNDLTKPSDKDE